MQSIENELSKTQSYVGKKISPSQKRFRLDAHDIFILLGATGARYSEIAQLNWQQVDVEAGTILLYRSKVDNETLLILTDKAKQVIERRANDPISDEYVFPGKNGQARKWNNKALKNAIKRAGLGPDVTPHVIRHTVATRLLEAGLNIMDVQNILGHAEMSTTRRYLHTSKQDAARKAADALNGLNREGSKPKLKVVK